VSILTKTLRVEENQVCTVKTAELHCFAVCLSYKISIVVTCFRFIFSQKFMFKELAHVTAIANTELVRSCQVYDRLGQSDITVEHVLQELGASYSAATADQVFSTSAAEYDRLRMVICVACGVLHASLWHDRMLCSFLVGTSALEFKAVLIMLCRGHLKCAVYMNLSRLLTFSVPTRWIISFICF